MRCFLVPRSREWETHLLVATQMQEPDFFFPCDSSLVHCDHHQDMFYQLQVPKVQFFTPVSCLFRFVNPYHQQDVYYQLQVQYPEYSPTFYADLTPWKCGSISLEVCQLSVGALIDTFSTSSVNDDATLYPRIPRLQLRHTCIRQFL